MTYFFGRLFAAALAPVLALTAGSALADVKLRYSQWLPASYPLQAEVIDPWFAEIARVTEGRVTVSAAPKVIGNVAGQYDVLAEGLADVALVVPGYTPGRFPLTEGLELPFIGDNPLVSIPLSQRAYEQFLAPQDVFEDIVPLLVFTGNPAHLALRGGRIDSLDQITGLKLRSPQKAASEALEMLGATPISKPMSEVYELASSGTIDGGIIPPDTVLGFNLAGTLKDYVLIPGGIVNTVNMLAFSPEAWEKITPADQEAIRSVSGEVLAGKLAAVYAKSLNDALAAMPAAGMTVQTLPEDVAEALRAKLAPLRSEWIEKAKAAGMAQAEEMLVFLEEGNKAAR